MKKPLTKRQKKMQEFEKMRKKQLEVAYQYPFCRRCKAELDPEYAKIMKKKGQMPLCKDCFEPLMKKYEQMLELWQKFNRR